MEDNFLIFNLMYVRLYTINIMNQYFIEFLNKTAANLKTIYGNKLEIKPIGEEYLVALRKIK